MRFVNFLKSQAEKIEKNQQYLLLGWEKAVKKMTPSLNPLIKVFIKANQGGKKIRGILVILGYQIARSARLAARQAGSRRAGGARGDILKIAAAYEIFHASILAHDDIIDQSPERREISSLYKSVGEKQAITLADAGFFLTVKIISETNFPDKLKIQALQMFSKIMVETAIGQMLDIQKGDSLTIMKLKTAQYTVSGPLQLGAVLGGAKFDQLDQLGKFGTNLGIAFQIRDDMLDGEVRSLDEAHAEALKYTAGAKKIIPKISNDPKMIKLLEELIAYMVERTK